MSAIHGDSDPLIPVTGGPVVGQDYEVVAVEDRMQQLAQLADCDDPVAETPFPDIEVQRWAGCEDGVDYELTTVLGGGHTWPGSDLLGDPDEAAADPSSLPEGRAEFLEGFDFSGVAGTPTEHLVATEQILDFFDAHDTG